VLSRTSLEKGETEILGTGGSSINNEASQIERAKKHGNHKTLHGEGGRIVKRAAAGYK
jgi:hypothetical protein